MSIRICCGEDILAGNNSVHGNYRPDLDIVLDRGEDRDIGDRRTAQVAIWTLVKTPDSAAVRL